MDLLLNKDVIADLCVNNETTAKDIAQALETCKNEGGRLWVYVGAVHSIRYTLFAALQKEHERRGQQVSEQEITRKAGELLEAFVSDKQWLAALAAEGDVFAADDPEAEQLIRAMDRFQPYSIRLLTRDPRLLNAYPDHAISPTDYCQRAPETSQIAFIDLKSQQDAIRPQLEQNIHRVLHHGQYIMGPEVRELEEKLAEYTGAKHCITVSSGTDALLISLMALGVKPGDEVITTPFTFVATAEVIVLLGATPVFVDIEPDTCNINASLIEEKITEKTKAIMPVSLYGQPADMDEINAIAAKYNLPVIEDAAQSFGATYKGKKSCNLSTIGCTSFFPSKPLGCYGDGGAIFTNDDVIAQACREIRVHGQSKRYVHTRIGVGGRMDTLQCAVVMAKLERFDWEIKQRREIGKRYNELMDAAGIHRVQQRDDRTSVFAQYTTFIDNRDRVQRMLQEAAIPTAIHYPVPLNEQPAYQYLCSSKYTPNAKQVATKVVSLAMGPDLGSADQNRIIQKLISL